MTIRQLEEIANNREFDKLSLSDLVRLIAYVSVQEYILDETNSKGLKQTTELLNEIQKYIIENYKRA